MSYRRLGLTIGFLAHLAACPGGNDVGQPGDSLPPATGGARREGLILLESAQASTGAPVTGTATAAFLADARFHICTPPVGTCAKLTCVPSLHAKSLGVGPEMQAGVITIGGLKSPITLSPAADGSYAPVMGIALWGGGEAMTFTAAGGAIPGFTRTLTAPSPMVVNSPPRNAGSSVDIKRSEDLVFSWSGGGAGELAAMLLQVGATNPNGTVDFVMVGCAFAAAAGSGTVPAALLQGFAQGSAGMLLQSQVLDRFEVGGFAVTAAATARPLLGTRPATDVQVTFY